MQKLIKKARYLNLICKFYVSCNKSYFRLLEKAKEFTICFFADSWQNIKSSRHMLSSKVQASEKLLIDNFCALALFFIKLLTQSQQIMDDSHNANDLVTERQKFILNRYIRRIDPDFTEIILTTGKVTLYSFDDVWTEMSIEGSLQLYRRKVFPLYRLVVLSRKNINDFKLNCSSDFSFEIKDNFLIFKANGSESIFGLWFEFENDAILVFKQLEKVLKSYVSAEG